MSLTTPGVVYGPPMQKALQGLTSEQDFKDADTYAAVKHGLSQPESYNFAMKREDAEIFVKEVESDPERLRRYENYRQVMMQINDAILDVAEDAGLLSAQDVRTCGTSILITCLCCVSMIVAACSMRSSVLYVVTVAVRA